MVDPRRPALEDRADDDHAGLSRDCGERLGGRAGDRLGEVEPRGVLDLAEVLRAEQLGQAGDLDAPAGGLAQHARTPGAGCRRGRSSIASGSGPR